MICRPRLFPAAARGCLRMRIGHRERCGSMHAAAPSNSVPVPLNTTSGDLVVNAMVHFPDASLTSNRDLTARPGQRPSGRRRGAPCGPLGLVGGVQLIGRRHGHDHGAQYV